MRNGVREKQASQDQSAGQRRNQYGVGVEVRVGEAEWVGRGGKRGLCGCKGSWGTCACAGCCIQPMFGRCACGWRCGCMQRAVAAAGRVRGELNAGACMWTESEWQWSGSGRGAVCTVCCSLMQPMRLRVRTTHFAPPPAALSLSHSTPSHVLLLSCVALIPHTTSSAVSRLAASSLVAARAECSDGVERRVAMTCNDWRFSASLLACAMAASLVAVASRVACLSFATSDVLYYAALLPLTLPAALVACYAHWTGRKLFAHN